MPWPFVSRARFEDREQTIRELKAELTALNLRYDRLLDPAVHVATGVHIDERFERKQEPTSLATAQVAEPVSTGLGDAINKVGRRATAIRSYMESTSQAGFDQHEREAIDKIPGQDVLRQIEQAMVLGTERAKA